MEGPATMAKDVFEEFEEMLDRMSEQFGEGVIPDRRPDKVRIDVVDDGDQYVVRADLPGLEAADVDLTVSGRRLQVQAEREDDGDDEENLTYVRRERPRGSLRRSITIPEDIVQEEVTAGLEDGVLTVYLPKVDAEEGHRIEIDED